MDIEVVNLSKEIYDKAISLGVTSITLYFMGGSDEAILEVGCVANNKENNSQIRSFESEINEWAFDAYNYSGAGDGSDYGDDIKYDLVNNKVIVSSWFHQRVENDDVEMKMEIEE